MTMPWPQRLDEVGKSTQENENDGETERAHEAGHAWGGSTSDYGQENVDRHLLTILSKLTDLPN